MADNSFGSYDGSSCSWCYYGTCACNHSSNISEIVVPFEDSISYSYDFSSPDVNYVQFHPTPYDNLLISTQFDLTHSAHRFSEPNLIQHYPISYLMNHHVVATTADHSESVGILMQPEAANSVDDDDFLEYDPTPYDGGYDQALTYGQPLPASDKICHPRSSTFSEPVHDLSSDGFFSYNSSNIPSPYGGSAYSEDRRKPVEPVNIHDQEEENRHEVVAEKPLDLGNGTRQYYEAYGGQMVQFPPYGYGLEAMDLCESLFGYWPCLSKELRNKPKDQKEKKEEAEQEEEYQCWSYAQDYIFGSPTTYG